VTVRVAEYSFDTSALIDPWRRYYPPDVFPGLWDSMATLLRSGAVIASESVHHDLDKRHGDDLHAWVEAHAGAVFRPDTRLVQQRVKTILRAHPKLVSLTHGHSDPFVIAHAMETSTTVVSNEKRRSPQNPKIPDVCRALGVECISPLALMQREKWKFGV
jgi:hypothetical protein